MEHPRSCWECRRGQQTWPTYYWLAYRDYYSTKLSVTALSRGHDVHIRVKRPVDDVSVFIFYSHFIPLYPVQAHVSPLMKLSYMFLHCGRTENPNSTQKGASKIWSLRCCEGDELLCQLWTSCPQKLCLTPDYSQNCQVFYFLYDIFSRRTPGIIRVCVCVCLCVYVCVCVCVWILNDHCKHHALFSLTVLGLKLRGGWKRWILLTVSKSCTGVMLNACVGRKKTTACSPLCDLSAANSRPPPARRKLKAILCLRAELLMLAWQRHWLQKSLSLDLFLMLHACFQVVKR